MRTGWHIVLVALSSAIGMWSFGIATGLLLALAGIAGASVCKSTQGCATCGN